MSDHGYPCSYLLVEKHKRLLQGCDFQTDTSHTPHTEGKWELSWLKECVKCMKLTMAAVYLQPKGRLGLAHRHNWPSVEVFSSKHNVVTGLLWERLTPQGSLNKTEKTYSCDIEESFYQLFAISFHLSSSCPEQYNMKHACRERVNQEWQNFTKLLFKSHCAPSTGNACID